MNLTQTSHPSNALQIAARPCPISFHRTYATASEPDLKSTLREVIPEKRELLKKVKSHGGKVIGEVKVENALGGMRFALSSGLNCKETHIY